MLSFEGKLFSIVILGRHNPQILNHDFLLNKGVLPTNKEPFKSLFTAQNPKTCTDFISTPVLTSIRYGPISLVVEEHRYQIKDDRFENPPSSPIIEITKKYFGELLQYTPLQLGGINLQGTIGFASVEDEQVFDERLGIVKEKLFDLAGTSDTRASIAFTFPWSGGMVEVRIRKPKERTQPGEINFNYEFKYEGMDSFLKNLDDTGQVYKKFNDLLVSLGVGRST